MIAFSKLHDSPTIGGLHPVAKPRRGPNKKVQNQYTPPNGVQISKRSFGS